MCEFDIFLNGKKAFEDVIHVKVEGNKVILKDVLGVSREIRDCRISEIDVASEKLVLSPLGHKSKHSASHRDLNETLKRAAEFHGHLGPFLAIGVRMGLLATRTLKSSGFSDMHVILNTGNNPPLSCIVDGIQAATGCTLGKGNVTVRDLGDISAVFHTKRQTIRIKMKAKTFQSLKNELLNGDPKKMEETARKVSSLPDSRLFQIEEVMEKDSVKER